MMYGQNSISRQINADNEGIILPIKSCYENKEIEVEVLKIMYSIAKSIKKNILTHCFEPANVSLWSTYIKG
jgi:hypothetical protein